MLQNPTLKTSLTTNLRNILRNQDSGLLTTSSRLLNAQVRRAELKQETQKGEGSPPPTDGLPPKAMPGKRVLSTIDLLRKQKEMH